jgi:hypothetical protein
MRTETMIEWDESPEAAPELNGGVRRTRPVRYVALDDVLDFVDGQLWGVCEDEHMSATAHDGELEYIEYERRALERVRDRLVRL